MTISERKTSSVTSARSRSKIACARGSSNSSSAAASWSTAATDDPRAVPAAFVLSPGPHRRSGSLGGSQPVRQVLLHDANALEIGQRIEAETSGRADWIEQAVSALPCTKQLGLTPERRLSSPIRSCDGSDMHQYTESGRNLDKRTWPLVRC